MNKYRDKSDFEINKLIARLNDGIHIDDEITAIDCYIQAQSSPSSVLSCNGHISYLIYDFCNNPADAMLIVIENKITTTYDHVNSVWWAHYGGVMDECGWDYEKEPELYAYSDNYYRAAMEVFLMMKDAENEK